MNGMNREDPVLAIYWSLPDSLWYPSIRSVYWSGVDISNGTSTLFRALATANGGVPAMLDDLVCSVEFPLDKSPSCWQARVGSAAEICNAWQIRWLGQLKSQSKFQCSKVTSSLIYDIYEWSMKALSVCHSCWRLYDMYHSVRAFFFESSWVEL